MTQRVFKQELNLYDKTQTLILPTGSKLLRADYDMRGKLCVWTVQPEGYRMDEEQRKVIIVGTGDAVPAGFKYLGSVDDYRRHVFGK